MDYGGGYYHTIEIPVTKEYKVHSSWTKTIIIPNDVLLLTFPLYILQKVLILLDRWW